MRVPRGFADQYGNIKPNSWDKQSENPSTFNAAFFLLVSESGQLDFNCSRYWKTRIQAKWQTNGGDYRTMEYDPNPDFSLDEKISVAAGCRFLSLKTSMNKIKLFTRDPGHYRPDVFSYIIMCKKPPFTTLTGTLLFPVCWFFVAIAAVVSCVGSGSSGPQLVFIKCKGAGLSVLFKICTWIINKNINLNGWSGVFSTYYPEDNHPSRVLAKQVYS